MKKQHPQTTAQTKKIEQQSNHIPTHQLPLGNYGLVSEVTKEKMGLTDSWRIAIAIIGLFLTIVTYSVTKITNLENELFLRHERLEQMRENNRDEVSKLRHENSKMSARIELLKTHIDLIKQGFSISTKKGNSDG